MTPSTRKALLVCGIISAFLYPLTDFIAVFIWKDYDVNSQTVSELFAIDAPSRFAVLPLFTLYSILVYLFGCGVWASSNGKRSLRIAAVLIIAKEVMGLAGTFLTPIHLRGVEGDWRDVGHGIITAAGVLLCMFPAMGFGAAAFGKGFRVYSILTMLVFIVCGSIAGFMGEALAKNEPTPWMGIYERVNIYGYMLWVIIFTVNIFKANKARVATPD